jgi:hypothetical protein
MAVACLEQLRVRELYELLPLESVCYAISLRDQCYDFVNIFAEKWRKFGDFEPNFNHYVFNSKILPWLLFQENRQFVAENL